MADLAVSQGLSQMTRLVPGGRRRILELIELAATFNFEHAVNWWEVYRALSVKQQKKCSFDDVCAAASVHASDLLGVIVNVGARQGEDVSSIVEASLRPKIVAQLAKSAARIERGEKRDKDGKIVKHGLTDKELDIARQDRVTFLQRSGFAPIPRGTTVHVTANANAAAAAQARTEPSVPSFADDMRSLQGSKERVQRRIIEQSPVEPE